VSLSATMRHSFKKTEAVSRSMRPMALSRVFGLSTDPRRVRYIGRSNSRAHRACGDSRSMRACGFVDAREFACTLTDRTRQITMYGRRFREHPRKEMREMRKSGR